MIWIQCRPACPVCLFKLFDMSLSIYIGAVKSEKFDYYKPYSGSNISSATYCPERIMDVSPLVGVNDPLFSAIMMDNDSVRTDWGCRVLKKTKEDLMVYVMENATFFTSWMIEDMDRTLKDGEEYLLVAFDDGIELDKD